MSALVGKMAPPDEVWPHDFRQAVAELEPLPTQQRICGLADLLLARLEPRREPDPRVRAAVRVIRASRGRVTVRGLAGQLDLSVSQLERSFTRHVGLGPKLLARQARICALAAEATRQDRPGWALLAAQYGYADQAHLARDVRELTGLTPQGWPEPGLMPIFFKTPWPTLGEASHRPQERPAAVSGRIQPALMARPGRAPRSSRAPDSRREQFTTPPPASAPIRARTARMVEPARARAVGAEVTIASPDGGRVEMDGLSDPRDESKWSADDLITMGFVNTPDLVAVLQETPKLAGLDPAGTTRSWSQAGRRRCSASAATRTCTKRCAASTRPRSRSASTATAPPRWWILSCLTAPIWSMAKSSPGSRTWRRTSATPSSASR